jgi:hypothetical protein
VGKKRIIEVECRCGQLLFKYFKAGRGRLIKCYLDEIREDYVGVSGVPTGFRPVCPSCGREIGIVRIVRGRPAVKINHGTVKQTRT